MNLVATFAGLVATALAGLRWLRVAQREHYLPLKVIKEHLDLIDRGVDPPTLNGGSRAPAGALGEGSAAAALARSMARAGDERVVGIGTVKSTMCAVPSGAVGCV